MAHRQVEGERVRAAHHIRSITAAVNSGHGATAAASRGRAARSRGLEDLPGHLELD